MRQRLLSVAAMFSVLLVTQGCSSATVDPNLREELEAASAEEVAPQVEAEMHDLGVTALTYTILDGDEDPQTVYLGRAEQGGLMQVASLSKTVAAAVILILADQQSVRLDEDIRPQITSLNIAELSGGDRPVTLRQLLSHTTGSSQSGYPGYPRGSDLPSVAEVISDPPRIIEQAIAFDGTPGEFRYSGGGYMIAQLWAEDVSGKQFAELADELLFEPLGMEESTFAQPVSETDVAPLKIIGADAGFDILDGVFASVENSWHDYPEQAAAGLWTTSSDYARFAAALMDSASGQENAIPIEMAQEMTKRQADLEKGNAYGLGTQLVFTDAGELRYVSHSGANTGYRALFSARPAGEDKARRVVVSIANTVSGAGLNEAIVFALTDR